jgi:hypothetical protein
MPRELSYGSTGQDVFQLQRLLNFHLKNPDPPYLPLFPPLETDGKFGPITRDRVLKFQTLNGLNYLDGIVGPETRQALLSVLEIRFEGYLGPSKGSLPIGALAAADPIPISDPTPGPGQLGQRTVQVQLGGQANVNPWFFQPLVITGQVNWLFRRAGSPDFTISSGMQASISPVGPQPSGSWQWQGFVQWGPSGILKAGNFDLINPQFTLSFQATDGQPLSLGLNLANQINVAIWKKKNPNNPDNDLQNIGLFLNTAIATNLLLSGPQAGQCTAPAGQFLFGGTWSFDITPP